MLERATTRAAFGRAGRLGAMLAGREGVARGAPAPHLPGKQRSPAAESDVPGPAGWLQGGSEAE